jgi:hypothetical protein
MYTLADFARHPDAVDAFDEIRTDAFENSEAELTKLMGLTPTEAAVVVNLAAAVFLRETSPARLIELAGRPDALALVPELLPSNVTRFPVPLWPS